MFLHLGGDWAVALKDVIAIGEYTAVDANKKEAINKEFLEGMRQNGKVVNAADKQPKSFVLTDDKIYLSSISSLTLKRRSATIFDIDSKK